MATLIIRDDDLFWLRLLVAQAGMQIVHAPDPAAAGLKIVPLARKFVRKINASLKKVHGHDCAGDVYLSQMDPPAKGQS